jgi:hypothetical protein
MKLYLANWTHDADFEAYLDGCDQAADAMEYAAPRGCIFSSIKKAQCWAHEQFSNEIELDPRDVPNKWKRHPSGTGYTCDTGIATIFLGIRFIEIDPVD